VSFGFFRFGVLEESGVVWSFSFPRSKAVMDDLFGMRREDVMDRLNDLLKLSGCKEPG
jgi:hypothetical protein